MCRLEQARVRLMKPGHDSLIREVVELAENPLELHALVTRQVIRMVGGIASTVEFQRTDPVEVVEYAIEYRRRLDPAAGDVYRGQAVDEDVSSDEILETVGRQMIADFGHDYSAWNAHSPHSRGVKDGLMDAEAAALRGNRAGPESQP